jgi:hypothetical protein
MSKRKIKDVLTKTPSEVVRTPQPGGGVSKNRKKKNYFKPNYLEVLKIITPGVYWEDDIALSGTEVSQLDQVINSNILAASLKGVVNASSLADVDYLNNLNTVEGISQFFIKQNNLTWITPQSFEDKILYPLGKSFSDFDNSSAFLDYLSGTLLPSIELADADNLVEYGPEKNLAVDTASAFADSAGGTHKYLIDNMSWLYFFNSPDPAVQFTNSPLSPTPLEVRPANYSTSGEVAKLLAEKLWSGKVIALEDCMKLLQSFLWSNYEYYSLFNKEILPEKYRASGVGEYTSGIQLRERLETLASVLYSDHYLDDKNTRIEEAFDDYTSVGALQTKEEGAGPFTRFMEGLSFSMADRMGEAEEIGTLVDIDQCPDEFLPYLADLIGWTLVGPDATRHRNQLRQAVAVYKAKGTKRSIQGMVDTVFGSPSAFNVTSGSLFELWESYVPNLMFYSLLTSSILTEKGVESFPKETADKLGLDVYSQDLDTLCRVAVDRIMWELVNEYPNLFLFGGKPFPRPRFFLTTDPDQEWKGPWVLHTDGNYYAGEEFDLAVTPKLQLKVDPNFIFFYRGREMPIPPWEEIKYYKNSALSPSLINSIKTKLSCFGVDSDYLDALIYYIETYTVGAQGARPASLTPVAVKPLEEDIEFYTNSFLFFTTEEKAAPNYKHIIRGTRPIGNELLKYLPYWNGKSSHFKIILTASSFDFTSRNLDASSKYALANIGGLVDAVAPAHAIPDIALHVSTVTNELVGFSGTECPQIEMGLSSMVSAPSAAIIAGFSVSTINPRAVLTAPTAGQAGNNFKRNQTNRLNDAIFGSGLSATTNFFSGAPRNILRRRSYKDILFGDTIDLRDGVGAAGYNFSYRPTQLPTFYSGVGGFNGARLLTSGIFSLGFIPSTLSFSPVSLVRDEDGFGYLIDRENLDPVWRSCQGYNSSDQFHGIEVSSTFPFRGLSSVDSSTCSGLFGVRDSLTDILALQHRIKYKEKQYEASSLVSGYFDPSGRVVTTWAVSSSKLDPPTFSSWYEDPSKNVILSMANQLEEATSATTNINYWRDFNYGRPLQKFFRDWLTFYGRQDLNFQYDFTGGPVGPVLGPALGLVADNNPHIFSHTYGPYLFNSSFFLTASSVAEAPTLITSTLADGTKLTDISYGFGQGPLSVNNSFGLTVAKGDIEEIPVTASDSMYVQFPEVRSNTMLSGVQFVDTSAAPGQLNPGELAEQEVPPNPTFSLIKLAKVNKDYTETPQTPFWAKSRTLEDNLLIQHSQPNSNTLPRLRYEIDPTGKPQAQSVPRKDLENFLMAESKYKFSVKAANFTRSGNEIGEDTLGVWIHTEPVVYKRRQADENYLVEKAVWSFVRGEWVRTPLTSIVGGQGIANVKSLAMPAIFPGKSLSELLLTTSSTVGSDQYLLNSDVITPFNNLSPRISCIDSTSGPNDLNVVSDLIFDTLTFEFNTLNNKVSEPPTIEGMLHTNTRKYYIEIFLITTKESKITLFDSVHMENISFQERASISTAYAQYYLNRYELKAVFDHFRDLSTDPVFSRKASYSAGHLGLSGGGRMSYRQNVGGAQGYNRAVRTNIAASYNQVSSLIIVS